MNDIKNLRLALKHLDKIYGRKQPTKLVITNNRISQAIYIKSTIFLSKRAYPDMLSVLCHEFAHLVAGSKRDRKKALESYQNGKRTNYSHHGRHFFSVLATVVQYIYPNGVYEYPWYGEYKRLRSWAAKEGWLE